MIRANSRQASRHSSAPWVVRAVGGESLDVVEVRKEHGDGSEPHDASVAGGVQRDGPRKWISVVTIPPQRAGHGIADVEAGAGAAQVTVLRPPAVPIHLIGGIEATSLDKTRGQTERHRCVVGPLARPQPERASADHVRHRLEGSTPAELHGCTDGVTHGKSEKTSAVSSALLHRPPQLSRIRPHQSTTLARLLVATQSSANAVIVVRRTRSGHNRDQISLHAGRAGVSQCGCHSRAECPHSPPGGR